MDRRWSYRYAGSPDQLFGVKTYRFSGGKSDQMRGADLYNKSGMELTILPDRGMDIASLKVKGVNLSFLSKTGFVSPAYYQEDGTKGFMRSFYGGFLTTCGLTYMGAACQDEGEALGLHGRISNIPSEEFRAYTDWNHEGCSIIAEGNMKQTEVFRENIVLKRRIALDSETNRLKIQDAIENCGLVEAPFMLLYHMNYGYPFISPECEIYLPSKKIQPRDEAAEKNKKQWNQIESPDDTAVEQVYFHEIEDRKSRGHYLLANRKKEIAIHVSYPMKQLPYFTQWKCNRSGEYVLGLEPGNCHVNGRAAARKEGILQYLRPLEIVYIDLEIEVYCGHEEVENQIRAWADSFPSCDFSISN